MPILFSKLIWKEKWPRAAIIMSLTMLIDLDHLLVTPIFDSQRCSIGFHPLHSLYAATTYILLTIPKSLAFRAVGLGCIWHLIVDLNDCFLGGTFPY